MHVSIFMNVLHVEKCLNPNKVIAVCFVHMAQLNARLYRRMANAAVVDIIGYQ